MLRQSKIDYLTCTLILFPAQACLSAKFKSGNIDDLSFPRPQQAPLTAPHPDAPTYTA
jgi:hypothetical protein